MTRVLVWLQAWGPGPRLLHWRPAAVPGVCSVAQLLAYADRCGWHHAPGSVSCCLAALTSHSHSSPASLPVAAALVHVWVLTCWHGHLHSVPASPACVLQHSCTSLFPCLTSSLAHPPSPPMAATWPAAGWTPASSCAASQRSALLPSPPSYTTPRCVVLTGNCPSLFQASRGTSSHAEAEAGTSHTCWCLHAQQCRDTVVTCFAAAALPGEKI